jgi:hypothetical protein
MARRRRPPRLSRSGPARKRVCRTRATSLCRRCFVVGGAAADGATILRFRSRSAPLLSFLQYSEACM